MMPSFPPSLKDFGDTCSFPAPRKGGRMEGKRGGRKKSWEAERQGCRVIKGKKEDQQTKGREGWLASEHRVAAEVFGL